MIANRVPDDFHIIPSPSLKKAAQSCPLLESDKAKGEWVECCSRRFFPLARSIAGDDDLAMDILQTSLIKVLEAAYASFDGPTACPWVRTIVANTAKSELRKQRKRKEVPLEQGAEDRESIRQFVTADRQRQLLELLREVIAMLPSTYSRVADLRLQQGLTTSETAEQLGISVSNAKKRLSRAKKMIDRALNKRLKQLDPDS